MMKSFLQTGMVVLMAMVPFLSYGATEKPAPAKELSELTISADNMTFSVDQKSIELEGNILIEDSEMSLTAKKMLIHLDKENKLRNIEAMDGVTVRKLATSESATGDTGTYDAKTELVTLRGNCMILQGGNTMRSKVVVYDRAKGTIKAQRASISIPLKKTGDQKGAEASPLNGLFGGKK